MRMQETELTMHEFVVVHTSSMRRWDLPASVKRSQQGEMEKTTRNRLLTLEIAADLLGDRWSLLIVRNMLVRTSCCFSELMKLGDGIATNILASRLQKLVVHGIRPPSSQLRDSSQFSSGRSREPRNEINENARAEAGRSTPFGSRTNRTRGSGVRSPLAKQGRRPGRCDTAGCARLPDILAGDEHSGPTGGMLFVPRTDRHRQDPVGRSCRRERCRRCEISN